MSRYDKSTESVKAEAAIETLIVVAIIAVSLMVGHEMGRVLVFSDIEQYGAVHNGSTTYKCEKIDDEDGE